MSIIGAVTVTSVSREEKSMQAVFVLDDTKQPLKPVHPAVARKMLRTGQAAVYRLHPFTIICHATITTGPCPPLQLKIDPGSKTTGFALLDGPRVLWGAELEHRGQQITHRLQDRASIRRGRRNRNTRYRPARFNNRTKPPGWLAPSLQHRVDSTLTWVKQLARLCHVSGLAQELVQFDTQQMENPEISGIEYQQGTLAGYELREYLLEKWGRKCRYCGAKNVPLEIEHIVPKSRGGSNRASNLCLACHPCNQRKGNQTAADFGFPLLLAQAKKPLKDAAAVNSTRWALYHALKETGLPVTVGTGGQTKYNRTCNQMLKSHWADAANVGKETPPLTILVSQPLLMKALGRGSRHVQRCDKYGFPRGKAGCMKRVHGFSTGDFVRLCMPTGKYAGTHTGVLAGIRRTGILDIKTTTGEKISASHKRFTLQQRASGYRCAHANKERLI